MQEKWKCRVAPSLGELEGKHQDVWGTEDYLGPYSDGNYPTVFFGVYGFPDFYTLWRHKGRKVILWAGSDIRHFIKGYFLDDEGENRLPPMFLAKWINDNCYSFVENEVEKESLLKFGINSTVIPSFMGNVEEYKIEYNPDVYYPKLYTSVSGNDFKLYGWDKIYNLAINNPDIEFHLYGNTEPFPVPEGIKNIMVHGRVPKERMNEEIKYMQGALRLTEFDGFSEIVAKSLLWGQWPVSVINYPYTLSIDRIADIARMTEPNTLGRQWLLENVNKFPWNQK